MVAEIEQAGQAVGFERAALEFRVAHFQLVEFRAESVIIFPGVAQADVAAPAVRDAINRPGRHALKRIDHLHRPHADQPHLAFALDLHGEQQQLRDDHARKQRQGFVS